MKNRMLLLCLVIGLSTVSYNCINEDFLVAVDLPFEGCYHINPGPDLDFEGSVTLMLEDELDESLQENITGARYYDIQVKALGTYNGSVSGVARINGIDLLMYSGKWSDFYTPQSLLGSSPYITPVQAGVDELLRVLASIPAPGTTTVTQSSIGSLSGPSPVPSGLSVCIEILAQVDATIHR